MAREFTMGARLVLEDDFSNPMRDALRATDDFSQAARQADDSASNLVRGLDQTTSAQRDMADTTRRASGSLDDAAQASRNLAGDQQRVSTESNAASQNMRDAANASGRLGDAQQNTGDETRQLSEILGRLAAAQNDMSQESRQASDALRLAAGAMNDATADARRLADAARNGSDEMDNAGDSAEGWGASLGSIKGNILGVAAAVGTVIAAFASMAEVDSMLGTIQAMTGMSKDMAVEYTEAAKGVYKNGWGDSIPEVTNDMGILQQQMGHLNAGASQQFLESGYTIRDAFGAEVTDVTKTVGNLTRQFDGLSETKALDMITKGFQEGANISDDFLDTLNEYGVQFSGLGFSAEQMFGTMVAGSKSGAFQLDKVGDAVKEAFIRTQDFSKTSLDAYKAIGLDGQEMGKKIAMGGDDANQAFQATLMGLAALDDGAREANGIALFGTQWEDLGDSIIPTLQKGMEGLEDFDGATKKAGDALSDNLGTQIETTARGFRMAFVTAAEPVTAVMSSAFALINANMGTVQTAAEGVAAGISGIFTGLGVGADFIAANWGAIGPLVTGMAAAWGIYGAAVLLAKVYTLGAAAATAIHTGALFAYRAALLAVNIVMMILRGQFLMLYITMMMSPIGLVVTALGLLIGIGILVYKNFDKIREAFGSTFSFMAPYLAAVGAAFTGFGSTVKTNVLEAFEASKAAIASWGPAVMASISAAFAFIGTQFTAFKGFVGGMLDSLGTIGNTIRNSFSTIGNTIATLSPLIARLALGFLGMSGPIGWVIAAVVSLGAFLFKLVNNNESVRASLMAAWESVKGAVTPLMAVFSQLASTFSAVLAPAIAEFAAAFAVLGPEFTAAGQEMAASFAALQPQFALLGASFAELMATVGPMLATLGPQFASLFGTIITSVMQIATTVLPMWLTVMSTVLPAVLSIVMAVLPLIVQVIGLIVPVILNIVTTVLPMLLQIFMAVFPVVLQVVMAVLPIITNLFMTLVPIILNIVMTVLPLLLSIVQMVFPIILTIIQTVIPIVIQIILLIVPVILNIVTAVIPLLLQIIQMVFPIIMAIISAVIPVITAILQGLAMFITGVLVPVIQIILTIVTIVFNAIMTVISNVMALVTGILTTATALIKGDWEGAWNSIKATAETIMNNILSFFGSIDLVQTGKDIIQGLIDGIGSMARAAADKVAEVAGGIKDAVVGFFDINSPSKVFRNEIGQQLGAGLILGMGDTQGGLIHAAKDMASAAMPNLGNITGPDLSAQMEIATNLAVPTVPNFNSTLDVATDFDGKDAPAYTARTAGNINPAGTGNRAGSGTRSIIVQKLIDKLEINADSNTDIDELVETLMQKLKERLEDAEDILGEDMGVLL